MPNPCTLKALLYTDPIHVQWKHSTTAPPQSMYSDRVAQKGLKGFPWTQSPQLQNISCQAEPTTVAVRQRHCLCIGVITISLVLWKSKRENMPKHPMPTSSLLFMSRLLNCTICAMPQASVRYHSMQSHSFTIFISFESHTLWLAPVAFWSSIVHRDAVHCNIVFSKWHQTFQCCCHYSFMCCLLNLWVREACTT